MYNYLQKIGFHFSLRSFLIFVGLCIIAWLINVFGAITFLGQKLIPHLVRSGLGAVAVLILITRSTRLLKKDGIPSAALGLKLSLKALSNFLLGVFIAALAISLIALILYFFLPFHFEKGSLKGAEIIKEAHSYFWGNFLEELIFRGYPLLVFSRLLGWRKAVWIMALPFGLFHLPGPGFTMQGLKMITTTATYSFVFSYAFILTGSLWTSIGLHVTSNVLLHAVLGLDGVEAAIYRPVFNAKWPLSYDPGFTSFLLGSIIILILLFLLIKKRKSIASPQPA